MLGALSTPRRRGVLLGLRGLAAKLFNASGTWRSAKAGDEAQTRPWRSRSPVPDQSRRSVPEGVAFGLGLEIVGLVQSLHANFGNNAPWSSPAANVM